ncbi:MAG: IMPACT family protein [Candidatus Syntrophosphaera sp.]|nr:IMPACT family protein [Candidatus Syntrophosphaera sp.]
MSRQTISRPAEFGQKIKRSVFRCFLFPIAGPEQARELIAAHNREYAGATHNCFAYVCGWEREIQYYSDAGEPSGTAGKPILNALLRAGMTNVLAIVSRWYGGVKLGVKGLIEAYGNTAEHALELADKVPAEAQSWFSVAAEYAVVDSLTKLVHSLGGEIASANWAERAELVVRVPEAKRGRFSEFADGFHREKRLDYHLKEN